MASTTARLDALSAARHHQDRSQLHAPRRDTTRQDRFITFSFVILCCIALKIIGPCLAQPFDVLYVSCDKTDVREGALWRLIQRMPGLNAAPFTHAPNFPGNRAPDYYNDRNGAFLNHGTVVWSPACQASQYSNPMWNTIAVPMIITNPHMLVAWNLIRASDLETYTTRETQIEKLEDFISLGLDPGFGTVSLQSSYFMTARMARFTSFVPDSANDGTTYITANLGSGSFFPSMVTTWRSNAFSLGYNVATNPPPSSCNFGEPDRYIGVCAPAAPRAFFALPEAMDVRPASTNQAERVVTFGSNCNATLYTPSGPVGTAVPMTFATVSIVGNVFQVSVHAICAQGVQAVALMAVHTDTGPYNDGATRYDSHEVNMLVGPARTSECRRLSGGEPEGLVTEIAQFPYGEPNTEVYQPSPCIRPNTATGPQPTNDSFLAASITPARQYEATYDSSAPLTSNLHVRRQLTGMDMPFENLFKELSRRMKDVEMSSNVTISPPVLAVRPSMQGTADVVSVTVRLPRMLARDSVFDLVLFGTCAGFVVPPTVTVFGMGDTGTFYVGADLSATNETRPCYVAVQSRDILWSSYDPVAGVVRMQVAPATGSVSMTCDMPFDAADQVYRGTGSCPTAGGALRFSHGDTCKVDCQNGWYAKTAYLGCFYGVIVGTPECAPVCLPPTQTALGTNTSAGTCSLPHFEGQSCRFYCEPGFEPASNEPQVCQTNGQLVGPACVPVEDAPFELLYAYAGGGGFVFLILVCCCVRRCRRKQRLVRVDQKKLYSGQGSVQRTSSSSRSSAHEALMMGGVDPAPSTTGSTTSSASAAAVAAALAAMPAEDRMVTSNILAAGEVMGGMSNSDYRVVEAQIKPNTIKPKRAKKTISFAEPQRELSPHFVQQQQWHQQQLTQQDIVAQRQSSQQRMLEDDDDFGQVDPNHVAPHEYGQQRGAGSGRHFDNETVVSGYNPSVVDGAGSLAPSMFSAGASTPAEAQDRSKSRGWFRKKAKPKTEMERKEELEDLRREREETSARVQQLAVDNDIREDASPRKSRSSKERRKSRHKDKRDRDRGSSRSRHRDRESSSGRSRESKRERQERRAEKEAKREERRRREEREERTSRRLRQSISRRRTQIEDEDDEPDLESMVSFA